MSHFLEMVTNSPRRWNQPLFSRMAIKWLLGHGRDAVQSGRPSRRGRSRGPSRTLHLAGPWVGEGPGQVGPSCKSPSPPPPQGPPPHLDAADAAACRP